MKNSHAESEQIWLLVDSRDPGGIETHLLMLHRSLRQAGLAPVIVLLSDHGRHPVFSRHPDLRVKQLTGTRALASALRSERPAVVHTHGYKAGILGRFLCSLFAIPVVSTFHSGDRGKGRLKFYSLLDERTANLAPAICVSAEIAARLPISAEVIPNFVPCPPRRKTPPRAQRVVGFVGRLSAEKGPDIFCRLANGTADLDFRLYGDGPMRAALEATESRVRFEGFVHDMETAWDAIDLLCITSRAEGLPLVALEAMARGIPVAAFGVGELPTLIKAGAGWIVSPGDEQALTKALRTFARLTDSEIEQIGAAARATVRAAYSPEAQIPKILATYRAAGWASNTVLSDAA